LSAYAEWVAYGWVMLAALIFLAVCVLAELVRRGDDGKF